MIGRTPGNIVAGPASSPGRDLGLHHHGKDAEIILSPRAVARRPCASPGSGVCIPSGATEVEKKAVEDATLPGRRPGSGYYRRTGGCGDRRGD